MYEFKVFSLNFVMKPFTNFYHLFIFTQLFANVIKALSFGHICNSLSRNPLDPFCGLSPVIFLFLWKFLIVFGDNLMSKTWKFLQSVFLGFLQSLRNGLSRVMGYYCGNLYNLCKITRMSYIFESAWNSSLTNIGLLDALLKKFAATRIVLLRPLPKWSWVLTF